jgi:hypothetical protein
VQKENAEVGVVRGRREHQAAVHVGVAPRFEHEPGAEAVVALVGQAAALQDGAVAQVGPAVEDDAQGLAGGVGVDDAVAEPAGRWSPVGEVA